MLLTRKKRRKAIHRFCLVTGLFFIPVHFLSSQTQQPASVPNESQEAMQKTPFHGARIKDLVSVKGVRSNPLIGYGLVIGLNGTGDGSGDILNSSVNRMLSKLGLNPQKEIDGKNMASVIVTADLPPFARAGQKIDVSVSSVGVASSLAGGTLIMTPLKAADGTIYAVANGSLSIGGLKQGQKFPTVARIPNGAMVEKDLNLEFYDKKAIRLNLHHPDFTSAHRIEKVINTELGGKFAFAKDVSTVDLIVPPDYDKNTVELMALIENFKVYDDQKAKIIINERTATIVMGGDIVLHPALVSHGDLSVEVGKGKKDTPPQKVFHLESTPQLSELVKMLNNLGVAPEDLISIIQTLKKNGSIVADLEFI